MRTMKLRALATSGLLAATMLAGPLAAMPVYAEEYTNPAKATVSKTITKNEGVTIPNVDFTFTAEQVTNGDDQPAAPAEVALSDVTINSKADSLSGDFDLSKLTVPGLYTYKITESAAPADAKDTEGYGWDYNTADASYTLKVLVDNKGAQKIYLYDKDNKKTDDMDFDNKYTKKGGVDDKANSLEISKVIGKNAEYANPDDKFTFVVTFTKPAVTNDQSSPIKGTVDGTEYTFEYGKATTVTLKAGQKLVFDNIEAGATYTVKETPENSNYKWASTAVKENGTDKTIDNEGTTSVLVGEKTNTAEITNDFHDVTITGVATTYGPFVAMIAAVVVAGAAYLMIRRRVSR